MKPLDPRLLRNAHATRGYLLACVGLGAATAGLTVAQATLLSDGIVAVFQHAATLPRIDGILVALAAVVAGRAALAWAQEIAAVRAATTVKTQLRHRLLTHLVRLGPDWLTGERSGELATLCTRGLDALDGYFARYLPQLVLAALVPAILLARILPADPVSALTIGLTLPLVPVFMALVGLSTQDRSRRQFGQLSRLSHHFLDVLAGLPTLKAYGRAHPQVATIREATDRYRRATMGTLRLAFLSSLILELVATLSVALVAVGIGLRLVSGHLDLRTALLVLILAPEAYLPLRQVGANYHASAEGLAAAEQVFAVLDTPVPPAGSRVDIPDGPLVVDGVTVRYPDRAGPVLEGFSLALRPGETVALTGPSGTGKSTLLRTVLGFTAAQGGSVRLGGVDLSEADPLAWRARFSYLPQRPRLFAGTVADNIALGASASSDAVRAAARQAGLDIDLAAPLGDDGAGLSAGQRQRVALARVFLRDTPIVLLDEPTANLDPGTESDLLRAIRRLAAGRTVLIVAHRPALLTLADRVVAVDATAVAA